jgi:Tol biopolymer transport system component
MSRFITALAISLIFISARARAQNSVGIFENHSDVGTVLHPGSTTFDSAKKTYTVRGSGENMWATADAFQFAWKKMSGDVEITADVQFANLTGNEHKKAVLMFRQSLDADSVYADVALHASGLVSLQYREEKGATTSEVESNVNARVTEIATDPGRISEKLGTIRLTLKRRDKYIYLFLSNPPLPVDTLHFDGESIPVPLQGDFYVGIGVCSHDNNVVEEATFSNVEVKQLTAPTAASVLYSNLETVTLDTTIRHVIYSAQGRFEAPNWSRDGSYLLFNRNGHIEKLPATGGKPEILNTGFADRVNNDHGISPDATQLAISDNSQPTKSPAGEDTHDSLVYVLPITGGTPRRLTKDAPSYWHGWSPDGKTLAFVGQRNGDFDIYTIPVAGGEETRITTAKGLDDGPEYSPDGQYIYFNSERTGHMQIWRMHPDGSAQEQVFSDDYNNWFPHISPDGKWMVFLTYEREVTGHPENKDVMLRLMSLSSEPNNDKKITVLAKLFGGQGTINVPSWAPDSKSLAFVSYQFIDGENGAPSPRSSSPQ